MKVVRYEDTRKPGKVDSVSVREAVTEGVMYTSHCDGRLEELASQVYALSKVVGVLAEVVHNAGLMDEEQLGDVVRYPYIVTNDCEQGEG